ncbi:alpha-mannosidase [Oscillatoria sp. CS-180]|uniref:alpha-mannosidase n=1 Tax=Oscillatoria sp. CS-180 TaxID=3021720 RepID=UPI00232A80F4|nr:alpha-mannosidase [Oscillatoria sp. CS-180]MDB9526242.1 alpha-mannosidase [Oscillatoria sp. CS-180]
MSTTDNLMAQNEASILLISETADRLKALSRQSIHLNWHVSQDAGAPSDVLQRCNWPRWAIAPLNDQDHIAWDRGKKSIWLCQQIAIPKTLNGFHLEGLGLRLSLTWWAEAVEVYVNGSLIQEGDLFDYFARIQLSDRARPGDIFTVAVHMLSPGHDDGALVRSELVYESSNPDCPDPGFVADELTVLKTYAAKLAPEKLTPITAAIAPLDWSKVPHPRAFQAELTALRTRLQPLSDWIKQRHIACVGHAHLDLAWLWPVEDTWQAAERTFRSVLSLQSAFPELTYTHSSPALFDWLETHKPDLFQSVQQAVEQGSWSIDAGLWVEPELNTLGGESLARQILYGQRYSRSRFGAVSAIAWLPDSFGFSWQLPQLLKLGGIDYFATQKLRWNETTQFPHSLFWWQGLDGTRILSLTLPPIGTDIDPAQMATHGADWEDKTGCPEMLWLPGMGDHGGGPTRDMLEKARRWANSPFFPQLQFTSVVQHLQRTQRITASHGPVTFPFPVWKNELYLELHRGCYTVHADQKWFNRRCEETLREAELFAVWAHKQGQMEYPKSTLETAWKQVLFNQFHDILPGTAIPEVFETANETWQSAYGTAQTIRAEALKAIARSLPFSSPSHPQAIPILVFNSLNWEHEGIVEVDLSKLTIAAEHWSVFDAEDQNWVTTQLSQQSQLKDCPPGQIESGDDSRSAPISCLLFPAIVPSVGYRVFWLIPDFYGEDNSNRQPTADKLKASPGINPSAESKGGWQLENECLRAVVDSQTGELLELWDKGSQQSVVRSPANQLQAFRDAGQYWDAWDIAPDYESHPLPAAILKSITWLEDGPLRQRLRTVRAIADSTLQQDYILDRHSPYLKVETVADWHATQVVLKAAFPLSIESDHATYEIPFGAIARSTQSTDPHEQTKWEVPAYRWADLSDGTVGLSVLTDYKHGFDARPNQLRLTLLKAPLWPDPQADRGRHCFTYALYPHAGDWRRARTPNHAITFNSELQWVVGHGADGMDDSGSQNSDVGGNCFSPTQASFLDIGCSDVHLAALKLAEENDSEYVLRFWEMYGGEVDLSLEAALPERTNLLEAAIASDHPKHLAPWEIATLKISASADGPLTPLSAVP